MIAPETPILAFRVHHCPISRVNGSVKTISTVKLKPMIVSIILKANINIVRISHIDRDGINLANGEIVKKVEMQTLIVGEGNSLIIADIKSIAAMRIQPHHVEIAGNARHAFFKCSSSIGGNHRSGSHGIN